MNVSDVLHRGASLMSGPSAYSRYAPDPVCFATTKVFSATGALERAARPLRSGAALLGESHTAALVGAKAAVCRVIGYPHIDMWEAETRPDWSEVARVFRLAEAA